MSTDSFHILKIKILKECPNYESVYKYYSERAGTIGFPGDSGVDLVIPQTENVSVDKVTKLKLGIQCELGIHGEIKWTDCRGKMFKGVYNTESFMLVPRSSISSTPLSMANSIGIIDAGYRGELLAPVRCYRDIDHVSTITDTYSYTIDSMTRLFQIVAFDGKPIKVEVVEELSNTKRGSNGCGSTGKS